MSDAEEPISAEAENGAAGEEATTASAEAVPTPRTVSELEPVEEASADAEGGEAQAEQAVAAESEANESTQQQEEEDAGGAAAGDSTSEQHPQNGDPGALAEGGEAAEVDDAGREAADPAPASEEAQGAAADAEETGGTGPDASAEDGEAAAMTKSSGDDGDDAETAAGAVAPGDVEPTEANDEAAAASAADQPEADDTTAAGGEEDGEPSAAGSTAAKPRRRQKPVVHMVRMESSDTEGLGLPYAGQPDSGSGDAYELEEETDEEDEEDSEEEEDLEGIDIEEVIQIDREELLQDYLMLYGDYEKQAQANLQLQNRIGEYLKKKKIDDRDRPAQSTLTDEEKDTRYAKMMASLEELNHAAREQDQRYAEEMARQQHIVADREDAVEAMLQVHEANRAGPISASVYASSGRPMREEDVCRLVAQEMRKEEDVKQVRLDMIRQRIHLSKKEKILQQHETLPDGSRLNIIDFEQLTVENQSLADTVQARAQDVRKLQGKVSSTVQLLSHIREKVSSTQLESKNRAMELAGLETEVAEKRDELAKVKKQRDRLRMENQRLKEEGGLLGHNTLLKDFASKQDQVGDLRTQIASVQGQYYHYQSQLTDLKQVIQQHEVRLAPALATKAYSSGTKSTGTGSQRRRLDTNPFS